MTGALPQRGAAGGRKVGAGRTVLLTVHHNGRDGDPVRADGVLTMGRSAAGRLGRLISRSRHWAGTISRHPANRGARLAAVARAATWHWHCRGGEPVEALVTIDNRTKLVVRPGQFSAVWTIYDGIHEWEELQFCFRFLRPDDHFVDVGANVGVFSVLIGTRVPGVRISAIEPYPPVVANLRQNLSVNDLDVDVYDSAVGAAPGTAVLEVMPGMCSTAWRRSSRRGQPAQE